MGDRRRKSSRRVEKVNAVEDLTESRVGRKEERRTGPKKASKISEEIDTEYLDDFDDI